MTILKYKRMKWRSLGGIQWLNKDLELFADNYNRLFAFHSISSQKILLVEF